MYTLLATCFGKLDIPTFAERVLAALRDVNEVKVLGLMLLLRLAQLQPSAVLPRLGEVAESMQAIMKDVDVKEDTVKSDLERKGESGHQGGGNSVVVTVRLELGGIFPRRRMQRALQELLSCYMFCSVADSVPRGNAALGTANGCPHLPHE